MHAFHHASFGHVQASCAYNTSRSFIGTHRWATIRFLSYNQFRTSDKFPRGTYLPLGWPRLVPLMPLHIFLKHLATHVTSVLWKYFPELTSFNILWASAFWASSVVLSTASRAFSALSSASFFLCSWLALGFALCASC